MNVDRLLCVVVAGLFCSSAPAIAGTLEISAYGGYQIASPSAVDVSDQAGFTARWHGRSFRTPPYWGVRGTYWFRHGVLEHWGVSLDYSHAKAYATDVTLKAAGWDRLEFTDGLNLLTLNALRVMPIEGSRWAPYFGAGLGINVPHVEVTRGGNRTFEYQIGGASLQAQFGTRYELTENWAAFGEYKGNLSFIHAALDNGATMDMSIFTHAFNLGISYQF